MKQSAKIALGGIIAALSITIMFMSSLFPFLTYTLPLVAGVLITLIVIEVSKKWAFYVYASIGFLSFFLLADKEVAVLYIFFFGYYPIVKEILEEKLKKKCFLCGVIKFIIYNITIVLATLVSIYVLGIPFDILEEYGVIILLMLANLLFFFYDYALNGLIQIYLNQWQKSFQKFFK